MYSIVTRGLFLLLSFYLITGCNSEGRKILKGDIEAGNTFRLNESTEFRSLYPLEITEAVGSRLASQVFEGLVKFDQATLEVKPALAERWESNEDASVWTFTLRKGVYFQNDDCFPDGKGRQLIASDVEWCLRQLCTSSPNNHMFWLVDDRIKGAFAYYSSEANEKDAMTLEGVETLDDYTIRITLNYPQAEFPKLMGHSGFYIYPKEAFLHNGADLKNHPVGTGAFKYEATTPEGNVLLVKNEKYWGRDAFGNSLPYLDSILVTFNSDKREELKQFRMGTLDMIFSLPVDMYSEVMSGLDSERGKIQPFETQVKSSLGVHYLSFNHKDSIFKDRRIRKAFNLALNRTELVNATLNGDGVPANYGIVPVAFKNLDYKRITPINHDTAEAKRLFEIAGFPNGEGFPTVVLHVSDGTNCEAIAQAAMAQLKKNLGVNSEIELSSLDQLLNKAEAGEYALWSDGWIADYPDPENFLRLFVSNDTTSPFQSNYLNSINYSSPLYDSIYFSAVRDTDLNSRMNQYRILCQLLIDEAVVMPLYFEEFTRLVSSRVHNFPQNSIEFRDFSTVWIDTSDPVE